MSNQQLNSDNEIILKSLALTAESTDAAIKLVNELAEEFYRGPGQDTWVKLQRLVEAFEVINCNGEIIAKVKNHLTGLEAYLNAVTKMKDKIEELLSAMEKSDMVLAGDLLSYEIEPMLQAIKAASADSGNIGVDKDASS